MTWLYTRIGTFITRLLLFPLAEEGVEEEGDEAARQIPRMNWYENFSARPRKVGGRFSGRLIVYSSEKSGKF